MLHCTAPAQTPAGSAETMEGAGATRIWCRKGGWGAGGNEISMAWPRGDLQFGRAGVSRKALAGCSGLGLGCRSGLEGACT